MAKSQPTKQSNSGISHLALLLTLAAVFVIMVFGLWTTVAWARWNYQGKLWPHITIAGLPVGGLTADQAEQLLREKINDVNASGFTYRTAEKTINIHPTSIATGDPDVSSYLVDWVVEDSVKQAAGLGQGQPLQAVADLNYLLWTYRQPLAYRWNEGEFRKILETNLVGLLTEKKEAQLYFDNNQPKISSQATGIAYDFDGALQQTARQIALLDTETIDITKLISQPELTQVELEPLLPKVRQALDFQEFNLTYQDNKYLVKPFLLQGWLKFAADQRGQPQLTVDQTALQTWLADFRTKIESEVQDAKFKLTNSRVSEFQASRAGIKINEDELIKRLANNFNNQEDIERPVDIIKPSNAVADVNDLGIEEIVGGGQSNFSGSPVNRRHNIKVGADTLNGLLIKPDEEFSLLHALGTVDAAAGYRQELVIKGDRTIPEFGGGLCQIGTTTFRAALGSGLPITQRRNHSYRVRYYEPAGTDATIYDPWPDFRFINDTGGYILIQTRIDGDELYFDFWGKKDGRSIEQTEAVISNIIRPESTKYIETLDLKPGVKKCTEAAHNGADAKFDYNVTYPDGEVKATTFRSHYVPWREVCLLGVEKLSEPAEGSETGTETTSTNSLN